MPSHWQDGNLVLHVSMQGEPESPDRLLLTPLGIAVTEPEAGLLVPGPGRTDLHEAARSGGSSDLGQVELTGPQVQAIIDEIGRSQRGIDVTYGTVTNAVVAVDVGPDARASLLDVFQAAGGDADVGDITRRVEAIVRDIFATGDRVGITAVRCDQHGVREPCPLQH
jgi:hypothetical protein